MTFSQLHTRLFQKIDKAGGGSMQAREKDALLNQAIEQKLSEWTPLVETNAAARDALQRLQRPPARGTGRRIVLEGVADFGRALAVNGRWSPSLDWQWIEPVASETTARRQQSWIHRSTNQRPHYVQYTTQQVVAGIRVQNRIYDIISESDPDEWQLIYLARPQVINKWEYPATEWTDFSIHAENAIIETARRLAFAELGDGQQYQISQAEVQQSTAPQLRV